MSHLVEHYTYVCRLILYHSYLYLCLLFCIQIKINDEICTVLLEILTVLLKDELNDDYTVDGNSDM